MKKPQILTELEREYVKNPEKRQRYLKSIRRQYDYRIREKAKQMMKDLEFLATYLPESQQEQVFTEEFFLSMIEAVVNPKRPDISSKLKKRMKEYRYKIYVANERVFSLCNKLIEIAGKAGSELIPFDIVNLFVVGESYEQQIRIVRRLGEFFR